MAMGYTRTDLKKVKVISQQGESALVEWHDGRSTQRAYLPARLLRRSALNHYRPNEFDAPTPEQGAPYGVPWAELVTLSPTPEQVESALHQFGIWTAADLERNHVQALAALQSLYARDLHNLMRSARDYQTRTHSSHEESP